MMKRSVIKRVGSSLGLATLIVVLVGVTNAGVIVQDAGFESPQVGPGGYLTGYQVFTVGQTFGTGNEWTVVGSTSANVAIYPNTMTAGYWTSPVPLNVEEGSQALDLTGDTDNGAPTGVQQTFATLPNAHYLLTFWEGQRANQTASLVVNLNGSYFQTATGNLPFDGMVTVWQPFSFDFIATGTTTTLTFLNNAAGVALVGLDDITVDQAPEPSMIVLLASGVGMLALAGKRRHGSSAAKERS